MDVTFMGFPVIPGFFILFALLLFAEPILQFVFEEFLPMLITMLLLPFRIIRYFIKGIYNSIKNINIKGTNRH